MIRIGILGDIGSGKSYVAKTFGYPVFNADVEVGKIYKTNKKIFLKLNKSLPKHIQTFPINKFEITKAILENKINLKKIIKIVHTEVRKKMNVFLRKNRNKKIIIMDIPLLLENKINNKNDVLVFVQSKKLDIEKRLKNRNGFNQKIINNFKNIQLAIDQKKKMSHFIIKNNFTKKSVKKDTKAILRRIL